MLEVAFGFAGLMAHNRLTPGDAQALWIPSDDEREAVCAPLARILARHTPISGDGSEDLTDGIEAAVAAGGYLVSNLSEQRNYAVWLQQQQQQGVDQAMPQ